MFKLIAILTLKHKAVHCALRAYDLLGSWMTQELEPYAVTCSCSSLL